MRTHKEVSYGKNGISKINRDHIFVDWGFGAVRLWLHPTDNGYCRAHKAQLRKLSSCTDLSLRTDGAVEEGGGETYRRKGGS